MTTNGHSCLKCGHKVERNWPARQCDSCYKKSHKVYGMTFGSRVARTAVSAAIMNGSLRPAKEFACVDCGVQATEYDHRDYNKPLDVDPVCHRCNTKRGKAIPLNDVLANPKVSAGDTAKAA